MPRPRCAAFGLMLAALALFIALALSCLPWHNLACRRGRYVPSTADGFEYRMWVCGERHP